MNPADIHLVVITGAGSGIGRATALRFAALGATVIATDRNEQTAHQTAALIEHNGGTAHAYRLDVTDVPAFEALAAQIRTDHGVADVMVNNAGIVKVGNSRTHTVADWQQVPAVNFSGMVHGCRLFGAQMLDRGQGGHLVNISSVAAFIPTAAGPSYSVSKAGVRTLSESLRAELAADHIGVSAICPGMISTNLSGSIDYLGVDAAQAEDRNRSLFAVVNRAISLGAASQPDTVAKAVVRAVRHDLAIVPVRPEAWLIYGLSRLAPGLIRQGARLTGEDNVQRISRLKDKPTLRRILTGSPR